MKTEDQHLREAIHREREINCEIPGFDHVWGLAEQVVLRKKRKFRLRIAASLVLVFSASFVIWQSQQRQALGRDLMEWQAPSDMIFSSLEYAPSATELWESPTDFLMESNLKTSINTEK